LKSAFTDHLAQPLDPRVKLAGAILDDAGAQAGVFIVLQTKSIETRGITDQDNKDGPELLSSINPTFTWECGWHSAFLSAVA
jgi:hypothetical protein